MDYGAPGNIDWAAIDEDQRRKEAGLPTVEQEQLNKEAERVKLEGELDEAWRLDDSGKMDLALRCLRHLLRD